MPQGLEEREGLEGRAPKRRRVEDGRQCPLAKTLGKDAESDQLGWIRFLIAAGVDLNAKVPLRKNPLYIAAREGRTDLVHALCDAGARLPRKNAFGYSLLHFAAIWNHAGVLDSLLCATGADVNAKDTPMKYTPLHIAARKGYTEVVNVLIRGGADVNSRDRFGNTPLHLAASEKRLETAQALVKGGANGEVENVNFKKPDIPKTWRKDFLSPRFSIDRARTGKLPAVLTHRAEASAHRY